MGFDVPSAVWAISLVDCTPTGVTRGESKQRNQQRNWETILQTFGILTQPIILELPIKNVLEDEIKKSAMYERLGKRHKFIHEMLRPDMNYWVFAIGSEHNGVFGDYCERLDDTFDLIPVVPNLDNTIELEPSVFQTKNPELINIQFFTAPKQ